MALYEITPGSNYDTSKGFNEQDVSIVAFVMDKFKDSGAHVVTTREEIGDSSGKYRLTQGYFDANGYRITQTISYMNAASHKASMAVRSRAISITSTPA